MTFNLKHHDNLQHFIRLDNGQPLTHRAYSFGETTPDIPILAREIYELTGILLMTEQEGDSPHGFISTVRLPEGQQGICEWCLETREEGQQHACVIITLYDNYYEEMPVIEQAIEAILQSHHENISEQVSKTT